jgi:hypothetical protein
MRRVRTGAAMIRTLVFIFFGVILSWSTLLSLVRRT